MNTTEKNNQLRIKQLETRRHLLIQRDPVCNANIINKLTRNIRKLSSGATRN